MNQAKRIEILKVLQADNPEPKSELEYSTPFELLVAVVLSAQATDKSVNEATRNIFPIANTPEKLLEMGPETFLDHIKQIGLFRTKTKNVMELCQTLVDKYHSQVPQNFDQLVELPGVGKKTASVVMNVAFGEPRIAVDTHVFRVGNRTKYATGKTPEQVQIKMERYTPLEYRVNAHHWFILLGRYICKARAPECWRCPIKDLCEYKEKLLEKPEKKKVRQMRPGT